MTQPGDPKKQKIVITILFLPLAAFIIFRMLIIAPHFFYFFAVVVLITFVIFFASKRFHRQVAMKCSKCGGPMSNMGVDKVFKGTLNKSGGENFPSLGKKIFRCLDCENEYHELIYYSGSEGDAVDYKSSYDVEINVYKTVLRGELPLGVQDADTDNGFASITEEEYKNIKKGLAQEVTQHNLKAGFTNENAIKIDMDKV